MKNKNILLIMCDQLNAGLLDIYGGELKTKHLNKLAQESSVFTKAYCQTPLCTPSRASIITGQYPHAHGIVNNVMLKDYPMCGGPVTEEGINNEDITTEKILWGNGYKTAHYGKWHLSGDDLEYYKNMYREHYEYVDDMNEIFCETEALDRHKYMDWYGWKMPIETTSEFKKAARQVSERWRNAGRLGDFYSKIGRLCLDVEDTYDYKVADKSINFIKNVDNTPFMLTCSFNSPHDPNIIPSPYYEKINIDDIKCDVNKFCEEYFDGNLSKEVALQGGNEFLKEFLKVYYASILFIDDQIGRVLQALDESGKREDTIIVFLSDHGDMAGGHGMFWKSTCAFYDEVARVPLLISCNDMMAKGKYDYPIELVDVMPTLLELCNIKCDAKIHGKSLVGYVNGSRDSSNLTAFSERLNWNENHTRENQIYRDNFGFMIRDSEFKYCIHKLNGKVKEFLYHMSDDIKEYNNQANNYQYMMVKRNLKDKLINTLDKTGCQYKI